MAFISSYHDKYKDRVVVWEKKDGKRVVRDYEPPRYFYVPDKLGDYEAITGEKLRKLIFKDKTEYDQACMTYPQKFESDLSPLDKLMMDMYCGKPPPRLTIGFIDIEVDYDPKLGWPRPSNPYAPVNALTIYLSDVETYFTLLVPPEGWEGPLPDDMIAANYYICKNEREIFDMFFDLMEDADLLSGWNSEFFDIPYMAKRAEILYGAAGLKKFAFERGPNPYWGEHERFKGAKEKEIILNIGSRVHLDYLRLFRKFNLEGRQSFSLGAIADDELDIPKLHYEGTLYELYRGSYRPKLDALIPEFGSPAIPYRAAYDEEEDANGVCVHVPTQHAVPAVHGWDELYRTQVDREFLYREMEDGNQDPDVSKAYEELNKKCINLSFIKFAVYNRRDVECLVDIDKKFKYIELASEMVHEATVNFPAIFGSVQLIDSAITNFCHTILKKIVFDKKHKAGEKVEGALVMTPKIGFHRWIGSCDINSLYPSTYRSLNLSPEKIMGQLLEYEAGWRTVYDAVLHPNDDFRGNKRVTFRLEGTPIEDAMSLTATEMIDLLRARKFALSAYGTVLDQGNGEGLLSAVLSFWFKGRKELQALKKKYAAEADAALKAASGNKKDPEYIRLQGLSDYNDMLQGVRKVLLNSTYGATLNEFCRFHDPRLGASTTGSGRQITTHMINTAAIGLIGPNAPKIIKTISTDKKTGDPVNEYSIACPPKLGPIYSDTDSCYFVMDALTNDPEEAVAVADALVDQINDSFPDFMAAAFFCQPDYNTLIKANREVVASSAIFRAKKKYVMLAYDMEGKRLGENNPKALKTQGSDIKISSTPEMIRTLLKDVTMMILKGEEKPKIDEYILEFRRNLKNIGNLDDLNILDFASVNSIKTYDEYYMKWERIEKVGMGRVKMPGHIRAAINHNSFIELIKEENEQPIRNGQKCKVLWLAPNEYGFTNMAFSSETEVLPEWFKKNFEVNLAETEQKLVDHKLGMTFDPIGWQVPTVQTVKVGKLLSFDD